MKRGEFSQKEHELMKRIENEFELFKYKMLSKTNLEIYENCSKICFYCCIYEYFIYAEDFKAEHIQACLKSDNVIADLYAIYTKYEYLRYDRWEDINELLNMLVKKSHIFNSIGMNA